MKFQYAPGLPGYGTQGADGSDGMLGMSIYFSELNGETQIPSLKSRIDLNEILDAAGGTKLPGYPTRVYQTGDVFVDTNGKVYEIDLSLINLYQATGERLNTSTIFVQGVDTSTSPVYSRYYNEYSDAERFVIDNVFSASLPNNYVQSPIQSDGIYGLPAVNFAQVKFVDVSSNGYLPYTLWNNTINAAAPETALALVKEYGANHWRWGNVNNSSVVRDVSLSLDFAKVNINGDLGLNDDILFSTDKNHWIEFAGTTNTPRNITILGSSPVGTGTGYSAGDLKFGTGNGSDVIAASGIGGGGGDVSIYLGKSGKTILTSIGQGRLGGGFSLLSGVGGYTYGNYNNDLTGGEGGPITLIGGKGGTAENINTSGDGYGGEGGSISIIGGQGGDAIDGDYTERGRGGNVFITGGDTGNIGSNYQGGGVYINGGVGDNNLNSGAIGLNSARNGVILTGTGLFWMRGPILADYGGTLSAPWLTFNLFDSNTGIFYNTADTINLALGGQQLNFTDGADGVYINPRDCSLVLQPTATSGAFPNGLGIEIIGAYGASGTKGGPIHIKGGTSGAAAEGGEVKIEGGNGPGASYYGGDVIIKGGSGGTGSAGSIFIEGNDGDQNGGDIWITTGRKTTGGQTLSNNNGVIWIDSSVSYGLGAISGLQFISIPAATGNSMIVQGSGFDGFGIYKGAAPSDIRLKNIHEEINGETFIDSIEDIRVISYSFNELAHDYFFTDSSVKRIGIIAQELEKIDERLVKKSIGNNGKEYLERDNETLQFFMLAGMKEQQKQINELKSLVEKQQEQINKLLELT